VQAYIAGMPGWKRDLGKRLDALIVRNVPHVRKAVKWNSTVLSRAGYTQRSLRPITQEAPCVPE
jgi:hypothetical protein